MTEMAKRGRILENPPNWLLFIIVFTIVFVVGGGAVLAAFALQDAIQGLAPSPTATELPTAPTARLTPAEGAPGATVVVDGSGWTPDETVLVVLRDDTSGGQVEVILATATVAPDGSWETSFVIPNGDRWDSLPTGAPLMVWAPATGEQLLVVLRVTAPAGTPPPTGTPTAVLPAPTPTSTIEPACIDRAAFVTDVTIPDNTRVAPGQSFVKTWRLRNVGTCTWSTDYALVFVGDNRMGGPQAVALTAPVAPGATVDISVSLAAPTTPGAHQGRWLLRNGDGATFGTGDAADRPIWVRIVVDATPTPTVAPAASWRGEYFANPNLTGNPFIVRTDARIDFDWGSGAPVAGLPADGFSVRWSGIFAFQQGTYRFYARSDDGVRVWLDDELIIDQWHDATGVTYGAERTLSAGNRRMRVEYYENRGNARIRVWWERMNEFPQWRAEYFARADLSGTPAIVRNDLAIDFDWGRNAPLPGLPADNFSVRWTRMALLEAGTYRFHATMDDGMRVYVDDALVIDQWRDGSRRDATAERTLAAGYHMLRVEYYERTGDAVARFRWERLTDYPDWKGEYWSNRTLQGAPVVVRNDAAIDFNWGTGSPAPGLLPVDNFSARWTRTAEFDAATYRFHVLVDDGARLWINDELVIDEWRDGSARQASVERTLARGTHNLRVEYYERIGEARIRVWWEKVPTSFPDWRGEYWSNVSLSGDPVLVRNDTTIDFNWGTGAPALGLPVDNFSARWTREVNFDGGVYRLHAQADDGVRVYVDGARVIDEWRDSSGNVIHTVDVPLSGRRQLVVEYYERTGQALVKFWWQRVGDLPTPTPTATPIMPTPTPTATPIVPTPTPTATPIVPTPTPTATPIVPTPTPTATPGTGSNRPPVAVDDTAVTTEGMAVRVDVLANDSDPDGDALVVSGFDTRSARGGTVGCTGAGVCTYTPPVRLTGVDTFGYAINDGRGGADTATVTITIDPAATPNGVVISEILPAPRAVDWNGDGVVDSGDEWIELCNLARTAADIGGWVLSNETISTTIPVAFVIQPGGCVVFFGAETGIGLDNPGGVVLIDDASELVSRVGYGRLAADASYSLNPIGSWHADWPPTPGLPNRPPVDEVALESAGRRFRIPRGFQPR